VGLGSGLMLCCDCENFGMAFWGLVGLDGGYVYYAESRLVHH
jgi:hypothetical protein